MSAGAQPVTLIGGSGSTSNNGPIPRRATVISAHTAVSIRIATPIQMAVAMRSRAIGRPIRIRSHSTPIVAIATGVARSSGRTKPVNRQPPIDVADTLAA
jgi:hypothetical protein